MFDVGLELTLGFGLIPGLDICHVKRWSAGKAGNITSVSGQVYLHLQVYKSAAGIIFSLIHSQSQ